VVRSCSTPFFGQDRGTPILARRALSSRQRWLDAGEA